MKAAVYYLRRPMGPTGFGEACLALAVADLLPTKQHPQGRRVIEDRWTSLNWPPYPNTGRNKLVAHFLDQLPVPPDIFCSLDDDMDFEPWQFYALCELIHPLDRPIVSGLYFAHNGEERGRARPLILRRDPGAPPEAKPKTVWRYRPDSLEASDTVGMGFCAIHRRVLEQWRAAHGDTWFDYTGTGAASPGGFGIEDSAFCARMRSLGHPIYVHTGLKVGHLKVKRIGAADHEMRTALEDHSAARQQRASA